MSETIQQCAPPVRGGQVWPLSVSAYRVLGEAGLIPENTELLYGTVYRKMSKSPYHSALVTELFDSLSAAIPSECFVRCEQPISCSDSEPEPDLAVIRGKKRDFKLEHPHTAELVVEICVTSHDYDRDKLRAYATAGVKECWLVLGPEKQIEVHTQPEDGAYMRKKIFGVGALLASTAVPEIQLSLDALFAM